MRLAVMIAGFCFFVTAEAVSQLQQKWISWFDGSQYFGELSADMIHDMAYDVTGNLYLTGSVYTSAQNSHVLTLKYKNDGILEWTAIYNQTQKDDPYGDAGNSIALDDQGNVYVAGFKSGENLDKDILLLKYSNDGTLLWDKHFSLFEFNNLGFSGDDEAVKIKIDSNGDILLGGYANNKDDKTAFYSHDFILLKYNSSGDLIWSRTYDYAGDLDEIFDIAIDHNDNIYAIGQSNTSSFKNGMIVIKYASDGSQQWFSRDDSPGQAFSGFFVKTDDDDNAITAFGSSFPDSTDLDIVVTKYNSSGTKLWSDRYDNGRGTFNNTEFINDLAIDNQNDIIITGTTIQSGGTYNDYLTMKYSSSGSREWVRSFNGSGHVHDNAYSLAIDSDNNIFTAGVTGTSTQQNYYDVGIMEYSPDGDSLGFVMRDSLTDSSSYPKKILIDDQNNLYLSGNEEYASSYDIFTMKFAEMTTSFSRNELDPVPQQVELYQNYPNPFNPSTVIHYSLPHAEQVKLSVYNTLGQQILVLVETRQSSGSHSITFKASHLSSGVYFYRLQAGDVVLMKKMILLK